MSLRLGQPIKPLPIRLEGDTAMGMLNISTGGSFPTRNKTFSAMGNGHAHAVAEAIRFLSDEVLPAAIEQDHRLHDEGARPNNGFDRPARG